MGGNCWCTRETRGVCEYSLVPCPKKCKDDNGKLKVMRRDLQQHLKEKCPNRDYSCEHCDLKGTYATTLDHYDTCEKKIITCTNEGCTMEMERMKIKNHLPEKCEHTVISCKYMSIGCGVKLKRKGMRAHEQDDKAHLSKTINTVVKLQEKIVKLQNDNMLREETAKLTMENSIRLEAKLIEMQNVMAKLVLAYEMNKGELTGFMTLSMFQMTRLLRKDQELGARVERLEVNMQENGMNKHVVSVVIFLLVAVLAQTILY